jgi:probable rRNA maturation factor
MSEQFSLINNSEAKLPRLAFVDMKNAALGKKYSLTVAIVSTGYIKKLNRSYRGIDKPTDILSFPLSKSEGEMYINLAETRREAKKFDRTFENFFAFLFIHGLVHLKGFDHSSTMERIEARLRKKFGI